jgi:hypothetical protein
LFSSVVRQAQPLLGAWTQELQTEQLLVLHQPSAWAILANQLWLSTGAGSGSACRFVDDTITMPTISSIAKRKMMEVDSHSEDEECFLLRSKNREARNLLW